MAKDFTKVILDHKTRLERTVDGACIRVRYSADYSAGDTCRWFKAHLKVDFSRDPVVETYDVFLTKQGIEMVHSGDLLFINEPGYNVERHVLPAIVGDVVLPNQLRRRETKTINEPCTGKEEFPCPK